MYFCTNLKTMSRLNFSTNYFAPGGILNDGKKGATVSHERNRKERRRYEEEQREQFNRDILNNTVDNIPITIGNMRNASEDYDSNSNAATFLEMMQRPLNLRNPSVKNGYRLASEAERMAAQVSPFYQDYLSFIYTGLANRGIEDPEEYLLNARDYDYLGLYASDPQAAINSAKTFSNSVNYELPREFVGYSNPYFSKISLYHDREDPVFNPKKILGGLYTLKDGEEEGFILSPDQANLIAHLDAQQVHDMYYPARYNGYNLYKLPSTMWDAFYNAPTVRTNNGESIMDWSDKDISGYAISLNDDVEEFVNNYKTWIDLVQAEQNAIAYEEAHPMPEVPNYQVKYDPPPPSSTTEYNMPSIQQGITNSQVEEAFNNNDPTRKEQNNNQRNIYYTNPEDYAAKYDIDTVPLSSSSYPYWTSSSNNSNVRSLLDALDEAENQNISTPVTDKIIGRKKKAEGGPLDYDPPSYMYNRRPGYERWLKTVPQDRLNDNYDLRLAYNCEDPDQLERWRTATPQELINENLAPINHLHSVYTDPNTGIGYFAKLGDSRTNPEYHGETDFYYRNNPESNRYRQSYKLLEDGVRSIYVPRNKGYEYTMKPSTKKYF